MTCSMELHCFALMITLSSLCATMRLYFCVFFFAVCTSPVAASFSETEISEADYLDDELELYLEQYYGDDSVPNLEDDDGYYYFQESLWNVVSNMEYALHQVCRVFLPVPIVVILIRVTLEAGDSFDVSNYRYFVERITFELSNSRSRRTSTRILQRSNEESTASKCAN